MPTRGELMSGCHDLRNRATFLCIGCSLLRADLPTLTDNVGVEDGLPAVGGDDGAAERLLPQGMKGVLQ